MPFFTRTDDNGSVIWGRYDLKPRDLAEGEVECTEADFEAARSDLFDAKPKAKATTTAKSKNADEPA